MSITASPLCWPPGKPRTSPGDRKPGRFGKRNSSGWGLKELTVAEGGQREPSDPGVAVYFELDGQHQCVPCDVYTRIADNLAAVADCIESLRTLERHDAGLMRAAFTGFAQLASPEAMGRPHCRSVLDTESSDLDEVRQAYRRAQRSTHPDRGGSTDDFHLVQEAWRQAQQELTE
ncbi:J domain-containing protein [Modicisalibacter radicis]|uniref:J domain-containing protein n=1 Tax=Halomonas sp. EAR18 TaxID=2518972 RepID=UPI00109D392F|nr:J domain-containing protein [Halomonas sp. EAR18]